MIKVKRYLKWHITTVLDHLVILNVRTTSKRTHDSPILRTMLNRLKKYGVDLAGSIFNVDRGNMMTARTITSRYLVCTCFQTSSQG